MTNQASEKKRPNLLYIMSDDHAAHAVSAYGSLINETPNIDRIAREGARLTNVFCTNSICAPSRASILTGTYSHVNQVRLLRDDLDQSFLTVDKVLQESGYQTAIVGKWHLGHGPKHDPRGFDYWCILPGQGEYYDPDMIEMGETKNFPGYVTDIITDQSLKWLESRDEDRPFCLMVHHKAPHRRWFPDEKHAHMYEDLEIPAPPTLHDDYATRASAAKAAEMRILEDIDELDTKGPAPEGLTPEELRHWKYQRFIKDYLRCVASVDDNVGRILDYLDENDLTEDTIIVYTSDQGFFLGDHGWFDKRFFYEESIRMPFVIRYPREIAPGTDVDDLVLNVDFAPLMLDFAEIPVPESMQGASFRPMLSGGRKGDWRSAIYYRYFDYPACNIYEHIGTRTDRYKLIMYYNPGPVEWEFFDLEEDPEEVNNLHGHPDYRELEIQLLRDLDLQRRELGETDWLVDDAEKVLFG